MSEWWGQHAIACPGGKGAGRGEAGGPSMALRVPLTFPFADRQTSSTVLQASRSSGSSAFTRTPRPPPWQTLLTPRCDPRVPSTAHSFRRSAGPTPTQAHPTLPSTVFRRSPANTNLHVCLSACLPLPVSACPRISASVSFLEFPLVSVVSNPRGLDPCRPRCPSSWPFSSP